MNNSEYIRTDLAAECPAIENKLDTSGITITKETSGNIDTTVIKILTDEGAKTLNKPIGTYITLSFNKVSNMSDDDFENLTQTLSEQIKNMADKLLINTKSPSVLVVGLGNRYITPDAIGPLSVKGVIVTRHIEQSDKELFNLINMQNISAISPGVLGQTGIETFEIINGIKQNTSPDLIIAIDALASRSVDRLATTIQIADSGISPGSGIGNHNKAINKQNTGVPVIAIGVPTMVSSSTLIYDALDKAGVEETAELTDVLNNGKSFYVTLNDCDLIVNTLSNVISDAINRAFSL